MGTNTLISGASRNPGLNLTGKSVGEIRDLFGDVYNIADGATATINGLAVSDDQILVDGETLVFQRPLGQKG